MSRKPTHPCPNCGGYARVTSPQSEVICARCSTILTPLPYGPRKSRIITDPRNPLKIGMQAQVAGKVYFAVGRIQYEQKLEGETYWWEEWVLLHPDGDAAYLEFDEGKWTLSSQFEPREAPTREELASVTGNEETGFRPSQFRVDGSNVRVKDAGSCRVKAIEGEIPWEVQVGDAVRFVDLRSGAIFFSAELAPDEVEWYRGRSLSRRDVLTIFELRDLLKEDDRRERSRGDRKLFGLLLLLIAFTAFMGWGVGLSGGGSIIARGSYPLNDIKAEGQRFGPYTLNAQGKVHRLRVWTELRETAAWVGASVEAPQIGEFFDVTGDFWDETGYDSDGYWHEASLSSRSDFRVDQPGQIFVNLYAESENPTRTVGALANFSIEEGVVNPTYLGILGFSALALSCIILISSSSDQTRQSWSDAAKNS